MAACTGGMAAPLTAQAVTGGRVVRPALADSVAVSGVRVVLHRVGRQDQGPLDSARTDRAGRFRFRFQPDTTALFLISARYAGIEYFSPPVTAAVGRPDTTLRILVADTSSTVPITVLARHLLVAKPAADGTREVLDLTVLENRGPETRVAGDSLHPSWRVTLPTGAIGWQVGEGDFSPAAVSLRGEQTILMAPIAPGQRELLVSYILPAGAASATLRLGEPVASATILLEEAAARIEGGGLQATAVDTVEGRIFQRWSGTVSDPTDLRLVLPDPRRTTTGLLIGLVGTMLAVLVGAMVWIVRRRPRPIAP